MSLDVFLFRAPMDISSIEDLPRGYALPTFLRTSAIDRITGEFPGEVDFSEPSWGRIDREGCSFEVSCGTKDICESVMLHVRGSGDPLPTVFAVADALELRALDCSTGKFLSRDAPEEAAFPRWQAYRNQIVESYSRPTLWDRIRRWFG